MYFCFNFSRAISCKNTLKGHKWPEKRYVTITMLLKLYVTETKNDFRLILMTIMTILKTVSSLYQWYPLLYPTFQCSQFGKCINQYVL